MKKTREGICNLLCTLRDLKAWKPLLVSVLSGSIEWINWQWATAKHAIFHAHARSKSSTGYVPVHCLSNRSFLSCNDFCHHQPFAWLPRSCQPVYDDPVDDFNRMIRLFRIVMCLARLWGFKRQNWARFNKVVGKVSGSWHRPGGNESKWVSCDVYSD